MKRIIYSVWVEAETADQADQVIAERIGHDEDYGFEYRIDTVDGTDHLLNAAPALLEAARDYLAVTADPVAQRWPDPDAIRESAEYLRAAIAKAEGGQA